MECVCLVRIHDTLHMSSPRRRRYRAGDRENEHVNVDSGDHRQAAREGGIVRHEGRQLLQIRYLHHDAIESV